MKKLIAILSLSLLFSSCEKEIDYQIPDPGDKIVLSANLVAGEKPIAYLSTSVYSMLGNNPKLSNIYSASLYNETTDSSFSLRSELLNEFTEEYIYTSDHFITEGHTYRIEANAPNLDAIVARTTIPKTTIIEGLSFDSISGDINFSFKDRANEDNFYYIELIEEGDNYPFYFSSADPSLEFLNFGSDFFNGEGDGRNYGYEAYFDDNQFKNGRKNVSIRLENFGQQSNFYVVLNTISFSNYRFQLSKAANGFSDGFFSEPVQIFSNVSGGYGIMSGKTSSRSLIQY